ncbi:Gfo/Idh/MocA family oxidoreductase [Caproiciproducens sp. AGMB10547]|uniref:Gfo/Idh/MocA family oxidoreductase n=1 Tax=Caproiciproducens faecalis TaxID=2820301 RepID=A0ABS7DLD2_9FIRM|nr:Gfo/Idh/MocA family oxidoreductase [Caproiciproducens faecalis]
MNFAILCAGNIAGKMAKTVSRMNEVTPYAIAARELSRARNMAGQYGFQKAYGSYEELLNDENVDLVYIASPHSHHYEHAKLCLEHGKHVLCEKPLTVNQKQAEDLFSLAESKQLFLSEAMWTRFMPFADKLRETLDSRVIGEPLTLTVSFGQNLRHIERVVNPELAGGVLLDMGIYPLTFASMFFGDDIAQIQSSCVKTNRGVDSQDSVTLTFKNGRMAVLNFTFLCPYENRAVIYGEKGRIVLDQFYMAQSIQVYLNGETEPEIISLPHDFTGYEYEVRAAVKAIDSGKRACEEIPHQETLRLLGLMDQLRAEWGIHYPFE